MAYEKGKRKGTGKSNNAVPCCPEDWECEEDLRAVARASAVQKDPERMKKVAALAKTKLDESKRKKDEAERMIDLGEGKTL